MGCCHVILPSLNGICVHPARSLVHTYLCWPVWWCCGSQYPLYYTAQAWGHCCNKPQKVYQHVQVRESSSIIVGHKYSYYLVIHINYINSFMFIVFQVSNWLMACWIFIIICFAFTLHVNLRFVFLWDAKVPCDAHHALRCSVFDVGVVVKPASV